MPSPVISHMHLKEQARRLGFLACGVAPAHPLPLEHCRYYEQWLKQGFHADMHYLEQHIPLRFSLAKLVPGARSVICVALSYHPADAPTQPALAWYAQGKDYHQVLRKRLQLLQQQLQVEGRCFADTAPVLEKYWAQQSGIGFIGRHTQLVIPGVGSAFFLGELITDAEFDAYDTPIAFRQHPCGTCRKCLDACPTKALNGSSLNAARCISYHTIESRAPKLPSFVQPHLNPCFYGCDRCLRACPHLHAPQQPDAEFTANAQLLRMDAEKWKELSEPDYRNLFQGSAVKRAKFEGLMRNIHASLSSEK